MAETVAELAVRVGADVAPLTRGLKKADSKLKDFSGKARVAATDLVKLGAASAAAGSAMVAAVVTSSANAGRELSNLSKIANTSVTDFQKIALGAKKFGVEQDKVSDILKDVGDKVGDFLQTGAGPMADFFENIAPKVGVTAEQFRNLSGSDALGLYVKALESANLSQSEMTFYMEAIASDSTALLPLLRNNAAALADVSKNADELGLALSDVEVAALSDLKTTFDDIENASGSLVNHLGAKLSPVVKGVGDAFMDAVKDMGGMERVAESVFNGIITGVGFVLDAVNGLKVVAKGIELAFQGLGTAIIQGFGMIVEGYTELANLVPGVDINYESTFFGQLEKQTLEGFERTKKEFTDLVNEPPPSEGLKAWVAELTEIAQEQAEVAAEARNMELEDVIQHQEAMTAAEQREAEKRERAAERERKRRVAAGRKMFSDLSTLMQTESKSQFEIGKKAAIAGAVVDTVKGAQSAYSALAGIPIVGPALGAAAAAAAIDAGNARVQQIKSQSFGSGASAAGAGSAAGGTAAATAGVQGGAAAGGGEEASRNVFVRGIDKNQLFTGEQLIDLINTAQEDGAQLRLAG